MTKWRHDHGTLSLVEGCRNYSFPFLKTILEPKCAKLNQKSDFGHVRTYCWLNKLRTIQSKIYGKYLGHTQFLATYLPPEFALLRNGFSAIPMPAEDTPIAGNGYHTGAGKTLEAGSRGRRVGRKVYCLTPQPLPPEPLEPKWPTETKNQRQIRIQSAILDAR